MPAKTTYSASTRSRPRKDGTVAHDVRFRHEGKQRTATFDDAKSAERWANVLRQIGPAEALTILNINVGDSLTVDQYAAKVIAGKSGVEGKTLEHYRLYMRVSISPVMGELPMEAVLPTTIARWVNSQVEDGYAAKTIKNRHGFLYALFQHALDEGVITRNPCAKTGLPESEREEMTFLSPAEFRTLLDYIPTDSKPIVMFLAATGMRWGEATAIKPQDLDLDAGTVRVSRAWKSSSARGWYLGAPKTKKSRRTISLPASVVPVLRELVATRHEFLFVNRDGNPVRQQNFWEGVWNPARRMANGLAAVDGVKPRTGGIWDREPAAAPLGKWPRVHDLRHCHASWLINDGVPLNVVQRRLGHESIQTTVDTYGHIAPDMMTAAAHSVDGMLTLN